VVDGRWAAVNGRRVRRAGVDGIGEEEEYAGGWKKIISITGRIYYKQTR
jgi:hypothetical protein